jgi:hypothetical protein
MLLKQLCLEIEIYPVLFSRRGTALHRVLRYTTRLGGRQPQAPIDIYYRVVKLQCGHLVFSLQQHVGAFPTRTPSEPLSRERGNLKLPK